MRRIISLLFVLVMVFSALSVPVNAIVADEPVGDIEEIDMFEYYYKNKDTFEILESALKGYNDKYGYETERKIRMGSGAEEFTAAEFDEEKITVYCSFIEDSSIKQSEKIKQMDFFMDTIRELNKLDNFEDLLREYLVMLSEENNYMASILLPLVMPNTAPPRIYFIIRDIKPFLDIVDFIFTILAYGYLIYSIFYLIFSKIKKKEIKNIKRKVVLSLLFFLYILFGGLFGIITWILSMAASI